MIIMLFCANCACTHTGYAQNVRNGSYGALICIKSNGRFIIIVVVIHTDRTRRTEEGAGGSYVTRRRAPTVDHQRRSPNLLHGGRLHRRERHAHRTDGHAWTLLQATAGFPRTPGG